MSRIASKQDRLRVALYIRRAQRVCKLYDASESMDDGILTNWGGDRYHAWALGAALIGCCGDAYAAFCKVEEYDGSNWSQFFADELRVPKELVWHISELIRDGYTMSDVAQRLSPGLS